MKLNKKKVFALGVAVCLIATLSMGSLAWFTDDDSVSNDFFIAGSEDQNPDDVFSIDVWEKAEPGSEDKIQNGISYDNILPGDDLYKEVNVENTGAYPQYARVTVTVSDAHIWQETHGEIYVPLNKIATDLNDMFIDWSIEYNADNDELIYVLYYNAILGVDDVVTLMTNVAIPEQLDRYQAAEMAGGFNIHVVAEAVQTENVGANAAEAFATVGMAIEPGNRMILTNTTGLENALINDVLTEVVLPAELANAQLTIDGDIKNKTFNANGQNVFITLTGKVENMVIANLVDDDTDTDGGYTSAPNVDVTNTKAGSSIIILDSYLIANGQNAKSAVRVSSNCDLTIDGCTLVNEGDIKTNPVYGYSANNITVRNTAFEGFGKSWAMQINGTVYGDVIFDGCTFTDCTAGIFKGSVKGGGGNGLLNGDFTFTNNTLTNSNGHVSDSDMFGAKVTGTITVAGNTLDGAEWIPGAEQGITQITG